jgi:hypothetical protein
VINVLKAFVLATLLTFVLASVLSTQMILSNVQSMGLDVTMNVRLATAAQDLLGMASSYLILIAVAFILALPAATWLSRRLTGGSALLFALAGFVAIAVLHFALQVALSIHPVAVTRTLPGLLGQCLAGAAGGWCYYMLRRKGRT